MNRIANNLDAVRLFAAMLVLVGHSYIFMGVTDPLFLAAVPLGPLGVSIFFVISGYLVSESWDRDPNALRFLVRRMLRILPGLAVCIFLTAFVLGPVLTTLPLGAYFKHWAVWGYLSNIGLYISYFLPGVFEKNRIANTINGSLWSLPVEFLMYLVVALLGFLRGNRWVYLAMAVASAVVTELWAWKTEMIVFYRSDVRQVFIYGAYFWAGAAIYKFNLKRYLSLTTAVLAFAALIMVQRTGLPLAIALWTLLPFIVMAFGLASSPVLSRWTRTGDYSYGIYIYAFPIQQTVAALTPGIQLVPHIILSTLLTLACAVASWHLVERRALRFKPRQAGA